MAGTHGNRDQYSDAPKFTTEASTGKSGQQQFGNNVFGVSTAEAAVARGGSAPGWVKVILGKGKLQSVAITTAGTGYANTDTFSITAQNGANAAGTITTNGSGVITAATLSNVGGLFTSRNPVAVITTSGGTSGVITGTVSGRAGRKTYETLVAIRSIVTDATSFANTSSANVANSTGSADDSIFPDA